MIKHSLGVFGGGIVRAIINRSRTFTEQGYDVTILTHDEQDYQLIALCLRWMRRLHPRVHLVNLYEYYRGLNTEVKPRRLVYWRQRCHGLYLFASHHLKKTPLYRDHHDEMGRRFLRETFHRHGYVVKRSYYHEETGKYRSVEHLTADGFCYLEFIYDANAQLQHILLRNRRTQDAIVLRNTTELYTHWFNELCQAHQQKPFVICDSTGATATAVINMDATRCHRIYTFHSNHLDHPYSLDSPTKVGYLPLLQNLPHAQALVVPTHQQQRDLIQQFGDYHNIQVIPHFFLSTGRNLPRKQSRPNTVVMVSRYHRDKGLDEAIRAFQFVLQRMPEARLEIYGAGPHKSELLQLVHRLNMTSNVFLNGYKNQVDRIYQRGVISLVTSRCEGFCFAILESMWQAVPVVSYDIRYGPAALIRDGFNGHLVPAGDREALANRIITLLQEPDKAKELGANAREYVQKIYNDSKIVAQWINLFDSLDREEWVPNANIPASGEPHR